MSTTTPFDPIQHFNSLQSLHSIPISALHTLLEFISHDTSQTMQELVLNLKSTIRTLQSSTTQPISLQAACNLFLRSLSTQTYPSTLSWTSIKHNLLQKGKKYIKPGHQFLTKALTCRDKIAAFHTHFIQDSSTILIHSYSRCVMRLLHQASLSSIRFKVILTQAKPNGGNKAIPHLIKANIPFIPIPDSAVAYIMHKVDLILVGAEGIAENGGLINQIGTYQIAIVAKALGKPFYAVAESFKFARIYPLEQDDLPMERRGMEWSELEGEGWNGESEEGWEERVPAVDFTPSDYITLLITDLGVFTPSGVSDELIKVYS